MKRRVLLGAFAGAHGVRGEAKVKTFTETEDGIAAYGPVESEDRARRFTLTFVRKLKDGLALVRSPEIASREEAQALTGVKLYVDRAALPMAEKHEFYIDDLIGLEAFDESGALLGRVVAAHNFGAGDIIEIARVRGETFMVPFTHEAILEVDLAAQHLVASSIAFADGE